MNFITNPTAIRIFFVIGSVVLIVCAAALPYAVVRFRRSLTESMQMTESVSGSLMSPDGFAFATFQQTIRDLKGREKDLQGRLKSEKDRAEAASALARNILDAVPAPAIIFNAVGLIQAANPRARELFGRASLVGFSLMNLFGEAVTERQTIDAVEIPAVSVTDLIRDSLRGEKAIAGIRIECDVRAGVHAVLELTVIPHTGGAGVVLATNVQECGEGACTDEVPSLAENTCSPDPERS